MKNKFYISLLWMGLTLAGTTSYAKPTHAKHTHAKHVSVSARGAKKLSWHAVGRKKHAANNPFSGISTSRTRAKLHFTHGTRKTDRRSSFIAAENTFPEQNNDDAFLEPTESNERIRSFIAAHHDDNAVERPAHYNPYDNETPRHIASVHGTINASLSLTGQRTGLSNELILQLTNIFAWDIDFAENLHQGDQFTVVYEETMRDDNASDSQIIAAEFVNQGRILTAIRYRDSEGQVNYYSPEGKPMRKAFLSTPVDFIRISSGFDGHRKHPILNRIRAHRGVDYAARTGTPVKAAGDGEVIFRGRKGGYGQVMIVKHGERYETLYAHLSDFKRGIENGDQVKQGEIIGYVGQTGLATGPHLHYEFRVDGVHRNPETLNLAQSSPLHAEALSDFKAQTQPMLAQLNQAKAKSLFAKNQYDYN